MTEDKDNSTTQITLDDSQDAQWAIDEAQHQADLDRYDVVLAEAAAKAGADAEIVALVVRLLKSHREAQRQWAISSETDDVAERIRLRDLACRDTKSDWDIRAKLAGMPATTLAGLQAKAVLVREYNNCSSGHATGYEDEAMAWSLAGDLLGLASPITTGEIEP